MKTHVLVGLWLVGMGAAPAWAQEERGDTAQLKKQCAANDGESCAELGFALLSPDGDASTNAQAVQYLRRACTLGSANGCALLGVCHLQGLGVRKDLKQADTLLKKACEAGSELGCLQLENLCEASGREDCMREQEAQQRRSQYEQACDGGQADACLQLGSMYESGQAVKRDLTRARGLYTRACKGGEVHACLRLGEVLSEGGKKGNAEALQAYLQACEGQVAPACGKAARLLEGKGQRKEALARHAQACELGDNAGCLSGARLAERGKGAEHDSELALRLYRLACSREEREACRALEARVQGQQTPRLLRRLEGNGAVSALAFSPRGDVLAVGTHDGHLQLWNPATGTALTEPLHEHSNDIRQLAFSEDGVWLASVSPGTGARLWDMARKEVHGVPLREFGAVPSRLVAFLPGQQGLLTDLGNAPETRLRVWNPSTHQPSVPELFKFEPGLLGAALVPGRKVVVLALQVEGLQRIDVRTGQPLGPPVKHAQCAMESLAASLDGAWLATGCAQGGILLWDGASGQPRGALLRHGYARVQALAFSPSGALLVSAAGGSLKLWDTASGAPVSGELREGEGRSAPGLQTVAFSPDGRLLAAGGDDGDVPLFSLEQGR